MEEITEEFLDKKFSVNFWNSKTQEAINIISDYPYVNDLSSYPKIVAFKVLQKHLTPYTKEKFRLVREKLASNTDYSTSTSLESIMMLYPEFRKMNMRHITMHGDFNEMYNKMAEMKENRYLKIAGIL